jgi:hypothetical protein
MRRVASSTCGYDRSVHEHPNAPTIPCLRCQNPARYVGVKRFHEGTRAWSFVLGDLGELFVNREQFDIYACAACGHVEFFVDGVGEELRGSPVEGVVT